MRARWSCAPEREQRRRTQPEGRGGYGKDRESSAMAVRMIRFGQCSQHGCDILCGEVPHSVHVAGHAVLRCLARIVVLACGALRGSGFGAGGFRVEFIGKRSFRRNQWLWCCVRRFCRAGRGRKSGRSRRIGSSGPVWSPRSATRRRIDRVGLMRHLARYRPLEPAGRWAEHCVAGLARCATSPLPTRSPQCRSAGPSLALSDVVPACALSDVPTGRIA